MKLGILIVSWSLLIQSAFADLSSAEMKDILGKYNNKRGDLLEVSLTFEEEDTNQPSLFGPQVRNFAIYIELTNSLADGIDSFYLDEDAFSSKEDGSYFFKNELSDCDNPGCANYWLSLEILPKKNDGYWAKVEIEISADSKEALYETYGEHYSEISEEELDKFCADYYGVDQATGYNYTCEYSVEYFLTKK